MWRRPIIFLLLLTFYLSLAGKAVAQDKSYRAERFDVDVIVEEGGSLLVTETVEFTFLGEPFTFVFRDLPTDLTDGITILSASVDGRTYQSGTNAGQVEIENGRDIRVTWHIEPSVDVTRTFVLEYRMLGVVRRGDAADLLRYQPLPDEFEYNISSSTVTFIFPNTAVLRENPALAAGSGQLSLLDNRLTLNRQNVGPNQTVVVEMRFAPGSLISKPPAWQARRAEQNALAPLWVGLALAIFGAGSLAIVGLWRSHQPGQKLPKTRLYEPPSDLPPAMAGALNGIGAKPSWPNALATLFDLADRGVLRIEESRERKWYRSRDFDIVLQQEETNLQPHEQGLLDMLFVTKKGRQTAVKLSKLSGQISGRQWEKFAKPLEAEIEAAGYLDQARQARRRGTMVVGFILLGLSVLLFVAIPLALGGQFGVWPIAIAFSLFLLSVLLISVGNKLTTLTEEAKVMADEWQSFYRYLKDVTQKKAAVGGTEIFHRFLPFAASYGLVHRWAKFFQKEGWTELPPYFHTLTQSGNDGMAAFVAMTAASGSSGGSAAGAGGAAGGAAGGGASGAG